MDDHQGERDSQRIGSQVPKIVNSQKASGSIRGKLLPNSAIIGSALPAQKDSRQIGRQPSETAAVKFPAVCEATAATEWRDPAALLPPQIASSLVSTMADGDIDGHGWDGYAVNYELSRALSEDERQHALAFAERLLEPAPPQQIVRELTRLRLLSVTRDQSGDMDLLLAAYVDELRRYPGDLVVDELRAWPHSGSKYWPSAHELIGRIERRVRPRRALQDALERGYAAPQTSPDWQKPTAEEVSDAEALLRKHGFTTDRIAGRIRPPERVPMTSADRKQMADELAAFRGRWAATAGDAAA